MRQNKKSKIVKKLSDMLCKYGWYKKNGVETMWWNVVVE